MRTPGARSAPSSVSPGPTPTDALRPPQAQRVSGSAGVQQQRCRRWALGNRGQPGKELDRCGDGVIDGRGEVVEGDGLPDLPGVASNDTDPMWIRGSADRHDDIAVVSVPGIGEVRQLCAVGSREEAAGSDLNREFVAVPTGEPEVDMQPPRTGVGDVEEFTVVLAAEVPTAAGARGTLGQ